MQPAWIGLVVILLLVVVIALTIRVERNKRERFAAFAARHGLTYLSPPEGGRYGKAQGQRDGLTFEVLVDTHRDDLEYVVLHESGLPAFSLKAYPTATSHQHQPDEDRRRNAQLGDAELNAAYDSFVSDGLELGDRRRHDPVLSMGADRENRQRVTAALRAVKADLLELARRRHLAGWELEPAEGYTNVYITERRVEAQVPGLPEQLDEETLAILSRVARALQCLSAEG